MFRNMVTSLFKHDRIRTTEAKAKELRRWADHIITLAKRGDLHALRQALSIVREKSVVYKVFQDAKDRFGGIQGGYTRTFRIGHRPGDTASMMLIELVNRDAKKTITTKKTGVAETSTVKTETVAAPVASSPVDDSVNTPEKVSLNDGADDPKTADETEK